MTDAVTSLNLWIPQVQGRYINEDWNPENKGFGGQCWDLAANWSKFLGLPVINTGNTPEKSGRWPGWAGNMVDCFPQTPEIAAAYTLHGPDETGQPGDIAVWGDTYWYYPATHVAPLISDKGPQLLCMSQNSTPSRPDNPYPLWSSGPTTLQSLPREGLIGFIRPRLGGINLQSITTSITEEGFLMALTDAEQTELLLNVRKLVNGAEAQDDYLEGVNEKVDEVVANARKTFWNTEEAKIILANTPAPELAAQIDAAGIAAEVLKELSELLSKAGK